MRKIIVTVAPVCHVGKEIPAECKNPLTPEEIAADTINCYKAGACDFMKKPFVENILFRRIEVACALKEAGLYDLI